MDVQRDVAFASKLPTMFLEMRKHSGCFMISIDVKDAFLTVKQQTPTMVSCTLAEMVRFSRVDWARCFSKLQGGLPSPRCVAGWSDQVLPVWWHKDVTNVMKQDLGMSPHVPCP